MKYFVCKDEFTPISYGTERECRELMELTVEDCRLISEEVLRDNTINHTKINRVKADSEACDALLKELDDNQIGMNYTKITFHIGYGWQIEWWWDDECMSTDAWYETKLEAERVLKEVYK